MKTLFITPRYYPLAGGVEYVVKSVGKRLVKRGHEVIVLSGDSNIEDPREEIINEVLVIRWPL